MIDKMEEGKEGQFFSFVILRLDFTVASMTSDHRENPKGSVGLWGADAVHSCLPEELVKVPMFHVFKDHDEWVPITTHPIELDNMFML